MNDVVWEEIEAGCFFYIKEVEEKGEECIHNVPQREKPKQRARIGTSRLDASILEEDVAVVMLRINVAK